MAGVDFERNIACVIGINQYCEGIPALASAVNDAKKAYGIDYVLIRHVSRALAYKGFEPL